MPAPPYFVRPMDSVFSDPAQGTYHGAAHTYTQYNYLGKGPIARAKRARFEWALRAYLAGPRRAAGPATPPATGVALDMGCADGVLLPSLARHFDRVVGVDIHEGMLATAGELVRRMGLGNVRLVCSRDLSVDQVRAAADGDLPADVAFVLETLEHVGTPGGDAYADRVAFVTDLLALLKPDGRVIVSVPRMVGLRFLFKHLLQVALRIPTEPVPMADVLRAGLLRDTDRLEPTWTRGHRGFNDEKLSRGLRASFTVHREFTTAISRFFVLGRPAPARP